MLITLPKALENDIMNFCKLNGVDNVNDFLVNCLRNGFNVTKFGVSPKDNFLKENKPFKLEELNDEEVKCNVEAVEAVTEKKRRGRPRKETKKEESLPAEKVNEVLVPKKKIRIIKS